MDLNVSKEQEYDIPHISLKIWLVLNPPPIYLIVILLTRDICLLDILFLDEMMWHRFLFLVDP